MCYLSMNKYCTQNLKGAECNSGNQINKNKK